MGDFFGKKSKRRQTAAMNEMNQMVQAQVEDYQGRQVEAQQAVDVQRAEFEAFEFQNPFADIQNPYAGLQRDFENVYEDLTKSSPRRVKKGKIKRK